MQPNKPTRQDIEQAYLTLLDRPVESAAILEWLMNSAHTQRDLRNIILRSSEFRQNNSDVLIEDKIGRKPPMAIQTDYTREELARLFGHIQNNWRQLGETEPHWSVLSSEEFRKDRIGQSEELFYESGREEMNLIRETLARNGIAIKSLRTCLEFGCGLGRITRWLAQQFDSVHGYDISDSHLSLAARHMTDKRVANVQFTHLTAIDDLAGMPKVDFVFTVIVLQHNPPPVIAHTIKALLAALNLGGVALFQVPVYRANYRFSVQQYLDELDDSGDIEMHVLPQREVFRIVREKNCELIEVADDHYAGAGNGIFSNTFLIRRLPDVMQTGRSAP